MQTIFYNISWLQAIFFVFLGPAINIFHILHIQKNNGPSLTLFHHGGVCQDMMGITTFINSYAGGSLYM